MPPVMKTFKYMTSVSDYQMSTYGCMCWQYMLLTATYFFFPKKHMPMLFQSGGLSGTAQAATRYLFMATSKSPWVCIMLPAARMAWE